MKKVIVCMLVALFSVVVYAQDRPQRGERMDAKQRTERMAKEIGLNDKQKAEFQKLVEQNETDMKAIRESEKKDQEAMRADFQKLREKYDAGVKAILTNEQYEKYQQSQKDRAKRAGGREGNRDRRN